MKNMQISKIYIHISHGGTVLFFIFIFQLKYMLLVNYILKFQCKVYITLLEQHHHHHKNFGLLFCNHVIIRDTNFDWIKYVV